jgi:hypothetical protein
MIHSEESNAADSDLDWIRSQLVSGSWSGCFEAGIPNNLPPPHPQKIKIYKVIGFLKLDFVCVELEASVIFVTKNQNGKC